MKRILSVMLVILLLFSLTACGSKENLSQNEEINATQPLQENDRLVVYFSRWRNTDYPDDIDATTSASIVIDENTRFGTTEYVAEIIAEETGADTYRIETVTPYTADFDELRNVNHDEMDRNYLPELKESNLDISLYDTVFVGYPVWASSVPQAVLSFLNEYDLSEKMVIPFCTHDGYGAGRSYQVIAEASLNKVELPFRSRSEILYWTVFSMIQRWQKK